MTTYLAVAVGVTPVTWTVCGLRLLARSATPLPAGATPSTAAAAGVDRGTPTAALAAAA